MELSFTSAESASVRYSSGGPEACDNFRGKISLKYIICGMDIGAVHYTIIYENCSLYANDGTR